MVRAAGNLLTASFLNREFAIPQPFQRQKIQLMKSIPENL
jgi:hypothetical protein